MARLELEGLNKAYRGGVVAVRDINLRVEKGEFITLLGPSGCGKTTLLRLIAGLEVPDSGNIYIDGRRVNGLSPAQRDIAMVFQNYALYPHMTVYENIAVGLRLHRVPKAEIDRRIREVAELLGIMELLDRRPRSLSGGQQQRVALGRAIARRPTVFLLDEPLSNLDALLREQTRSELKLLFSSIGATVLYVTHDQTEAMTMSDRVAIMKDGCLQQVGSPGEVYSHPLNLFVAGFVGSPPMNFFEVYPVEEGLRWRDCFIPFSRRLPLRDYKKVLVGIRPEDLIIETDYRPGSIEVSIHLIEPLGPVTIVTLNHRGSLFKALVNATEFPFPQDNIWVRFNEERCHIFDPDTGEALS